MSKCLALKRINGLLDEGSFVELGALVSARTTDFSLKPYGEPSDGIITGYGQIEGNPVYVYSQNRDVLNGTIGEMHAKKIVDLYDKVMKSGVPIIGLIDCGGFRLQESVDALDSFGKVLAKQIEAADSCLQISAVMGTCAGGMTMVPALSDFTFMVKDAQMFVNAPHTLKDNQKLARSFSSGQFQNEVSGQAQMLETEEEVLEKIRELILMLEDDEYGCCEESELNRYISEKTAASRDTRALLKECADNYLFTEMYGSYHPEIVTGFLKLNGIRVGVVGNASALYDENGEKIADLPTGLTAEGCRKAAKFVRFCSSKDLPLLTVIAADGFDAAESTEMDLPSALAELVKAFTEIWATKVNLLVGDTYGSAYVAMNTKAIGGADMVFAWDGVKLGMMEAEKAANILSADADAAARERQASEYEKLQNSVEAAAARGSVDTVIAPESTRKHLIMAFSML